MNPARNLAYDLGYDFSYILNLTRDFHFDFARGYGFIVDWGNDVEDDDNENHYPTDRITDFDFDFNLSFALQIALIFSRVQNFSFESSQMSEFAQYFAKVVELGKNLSEDQFQKLSDLIVPSKDDSQVAWQKFSQDLHVIMQNDRKIAEKWGLNSVQIDKLSNYLEASQLLLYCLDLAYVSNREDIEDNLLLPVLLNE